jgi:hypothetical protein
MSIGNFRLIDLIRQKSDAGVLPREHPENIFGGYGFGDACSGCGDPWVEAKASSNSRSAGRTTVSTPAATAFGKAN